MKRYQFIIVFLVLILPLMSISQSSDKINPKLYAKYSNEYLETLKTDHPDRLAFLNYFADETCYIVDMPNKPIETIDLQKNDAEDGYVITLSDLEDFNMYEYNIVPAINEQKYYKVGNTGKLIIVRSEMSMTKRFENAKRTK